MRFFRALFKTSVLRNAQEKKQHNENLDDKINSEFNICNDPKENDVDTDKKREFTEESSITLTWKLILRRIDMAFFVIFSVIVSLARISYFSFLSLGDTENEP